MPVEVVVHEIRLPQKANANDRMDPYIKFGLDNWRHRTSLRVNCDEGETIYEESMTFPNEGNRELQISLIDDHALKDHVLGFGRIWLRPDYEGKAEYELVLDEPSHRLRGDPVVHLTLYYSQ